MCNLMTLVVPFLLCWKWNPLNASKTYYRFYMYTSTYKCVNPLLPIATSTSRYLIGSASNNYCSKHSFNNTVVKL